MNLNLEGKVAIVTGAARGIGRAIALTFAREGANVIVSDIDLGVANAVAEEAKALGVQAIAVKADVTKVGEVRQMVKETLDKFGNVDILVNNAGILYVGGKTVVRKLFHESIEEEWSGEINVTLYGMLNCTKAAIAPMIKQKSGNIVNIASDAGRTHSPRNSIYGAGKGGIIAFSRNLAYELGPFGIRVNCVSPGIIKTTRIESVKSGAETDPEAVKAVGELEAVVKLAPIGRMGTPQDIANTAVFLASDVSSYITGQTLSVDGGRIMP